MPKVLSAQDYYAVILGMPGTGKMTVMIKTLIALGKTVHSAVNTVLAVDFGILRLGNMDKVIIVSPLFWWYLEKC
jgi:hypothetical protein